MTVNATLSRPAALVHLQRLGIDPAKAPSVLLTAPVAARWNTGFGQTAYYYYSRDLDRAAATHLPCAACDGEGNVWNNADPSSGQSVPCEVCQ